MAAKAALLLGIQVEAFSPRLSSEISLMAQAVSSPAANAAPAPDFNMAALQRLKGKATPRSLAALDRIEKAAQQGRLKEADLVLLEGIAARFEELNTNQP